MVFKLAKGAARPWQGRHVRVGFGGELVLDKVTRLGAVVYASAPQSSLIDKSIRLTLGLPKAVDLQPENPHRAERYMAPSIGPTQAPK